RGTAGSRSGWAGRAGARAARRCRSRPPAARAPRPPASGASSPPPQRALDLALLLALADRVALVVAALAARQRELDLGAAVLEVERERHQGEAALRHLPRQPRDLAAVREQLAIAARIRVLAPGLLVGAHGRVHQPRLAAPHHGVGFGEAGLALAQRLHLRADEHDAGLERVEDLVVVARPPVLRDELAP